MKRLMMLACLALALVFVTSAFASGSRDLRGYNFVEGRYGQALTGEPVGFAGTKADTVVIHQVDFQTAGGAPSSDGWTSVDLTFLTNAIWHVDTFNAANLDTVTTSSWTGTATCPIPPLRPTSF